MKNIFGIYKKYWQRNQGQGAHTLSMRVGARPPPGRAPLSRRQALGPLALILSPKILINSKKCLLGFAGHSENFSFLHIRQHHGTSAKNSVSLG